MSLLLSIVSIWNNKQTSLTVTARPISVSAFWKGCENYKAEALKWRVLSENDTEVEIADLGATVYAFTSRLNGQRRVIGKTARMAQAMQGEDKDEAR